MFLLGKILVQLTSPLGLCFLGVLVGAVAIVCKRKKIGTALIALAFVWVFVWSLPVASVWLAGRLERQYPQRAAGDYPTADAIVVLGGGVQAARHGWRETPRLVVGADRVWLGAQLYRAGRAPVLILSGGNSEWSGADQTEADAMRIFVEDLGVPATAILLEDKSRNTREDAQFTKELMADHGFSKILLVTSALHMPRALTLFEGPGITVIPAVTDFDAIPPRNEWQAWLPDIEALDRSSRALKEYLGMALHH